MGRNPRWGRNARRVRESNPLAAAYLALAARGPLGIGATLCRWRLALETYYKTQHLADFGKISEGSPDLGKKFFDYYGAVFADGALTAREKSLIALAVAHAVQCPYCIDAYTQDCQQKGADFEQMTEALHVAVAIRGGASLVHGMQMREHAQKSGM
jgi:alkylhydroperoxidase/carboxymuconolactone decarboxylase family protein